MSYFARYNIQVYKLLKKFVYHSQITRLLSQHSPKPKTTASSLSTYRFYGGVTLHHSPTTNPGYRRPTPATDDQRRLPTTKLARLRCCFISALPATDEPSTTATNLSLPYKGFLTTPKFLLIG